MYCFSIFVICLYCSLLGHQLCLKLVAPKISCFATLIVIVVLRAIITDFTAEIVAKQPHQLFCEWMLS